MRPAVTQDLQEILLVERNSFEHPWTIQEFNSQEQCFVATNGTAVAGYMAIGSTKHGYQIKSIAVHPQYRRLYVGTSLIEYAKQNMVNRSRLSSVVRESNLGAQLFLKNNNFRATKILHGYYELTDESAYVMIYKNVLSTSCKKLLTAT